MWLQMMLLFLSVFAFFEENANEFAGRIYILFLGGEYRHSISSHQVAILSLLLFQNFTQRALNFLTSLYQKCPLHPSASHPTKSAAHHPQPETANTRRRLEKASTRPQLEKASTRPQPEKASTRPPKDKIPNTRPPRCKLQDLKQALQIHLPVRRIRQARPRLHQAVVGSCAFVQSTYGNNLVGHAWAVSMATYDGFWGLRVGLVEWFRWRG